MLKDKAAAIVGVVALAGFAILIAVLLGHLDDPELRWQRMVYVFGAVEAIAFSAAGFFFGKEVNRQRAENAEKRATASAADAQQATGDKRAAVESLVTLSTEIEKKAAARKAVTGLPVWQHDDDLKVLDVAGRAPNLASWIAEAKRTSQSTVADTGLEDLRDMAQAMVKRLATS